jgi:hypothetical protein
MLVNGMGTFEFIVYNICNLYFVIGKCWPIVFVNIFQIQIAFGFPTSCSSEHNSIVKQRVINKAGTDATMPINTVS